jgi:hypothetical protein
VTQQDKPNSLDTRSSHQIESEIDETRDAISEDIRALGEKLDREHLKEQARERARETAHGVKQAAVDKAVAWKDSTMDTIGSRGRRAGGATWSYAKSNAIPLTMIGVGTGWLAASQRSHARRGAQPSLPETAESAGTRVQEQAESAGMAVRERAESAGAAVHERAESARTRVRDQAHRAGTRVREQAEGMYGRMGEGVRSAQDRMSHGMARTRDMVQERAHLAQTKGRDLADSNPIGFALASLLAGVGVGMLLPSTLKERKVLGPAREQVGRVVHETRDAAASAFSG